MVRQELYIAVPNLFRCPISLDVMKSPVSLCTGVTYDRSSIQHWLESGHDTCPATMQILSTKEFVPNLTLHRLIAHWSHQLTVPEQEVRVWIEKIKSENESENSCVDYLVKVAKFATGCEANRRFLASYGGFVEAVFGVLNRKRRSEIAVLESAVRVLNLIVNENGVKEKLNRLILNTYNCLPLFLEILREGNLDSKIGSIKILDSISLDNESKRRVLETENLLSALFDYLKLAEDQALNDAILSILITLSVYRSVKAQLVELGMVQILKRILSDSRTQILTVEKSIKMLSIVATCSEGRLALSEEASCAGRVVERVMKVGKTAREDAVVVIWSMCCVYKDARVKEAVVNSNGLTKLLLVMQSENEGIVRKMCGDLVKVLGKASGLGNYETKTSHIMPY